MSISSLGFQHLSLRSAADIHELFRLLGYPVYEPEPFEGPDLDELELDEVDVASVNRAYVVSNLDNHTVYLYEVDDLRQTRLRGLAWNALQRGTALLVVTRDYREIVFAHPRIVGNPTKSNVRVDKLKMIVSDPTRHDLDTLNAIHAHRRTGQQVYEAQAEAFNVTKITKRFYDEYKVHYDLARDAIRRYNRGIPEFQNADQEAKLHAFTQRLLGRLMFLYFLQRKGWLGGRKRFLTDQFIETVKRHADEFRGDQETFYYYSEVLEPLFFETMNTRRLEDSTRWPGVRIPYLNGGLFDKSRDPEGVIVLPDSLFDPNSSDGLLAFFNRYNFTIANDTPLEQDVAVDPEMLGKVFENMLEERDRGQTGSFYTPRTIVSFMCQEALAGYLEESANIPRDTTRAQFDPDADLALTPDEAQRINAALDTLTVLDPAVGSGSFLIGMMNEIIQLRRACAHALGVEVTSAMLADWKEAIIRDTLYGVDIKPEAIEIAQLRLWLALVVDQTIEQARPLPNLDYKLMAGNSLIETIDGEPVLTDSATAMLDASAKDEWEHTDSQLKMFDPNPMQMRMGLFESEKQTQQERIRLDELRQRFFRATPEERRRLREEITTQERRIVFSSLKEKAEALQEQINHLGKKAALAGGTLSRADRRKLEDASAKLTRITDLQEQMRNPEVAPPFFLYRLHFSEVFAAKGGFDIVVANPPYVRGTALSEQKDLLRARFPNVYDGYADLYVYFFARSMELVRAHGQVALITSNKYLRARYGKKLRGFLSDAITLVSIVDFGDLPIFDATAYPCIVMGTVAIPDRSNRVITAAISDIDAISNLRKSAIDLGLEIEQRQLGEDVWQIAERNTHAVLVKIDTNSHLLGDIVGGKIFRGIITGRNQIFIIDVHTRDQLIAEDERSSELIKSYLMGSDVARWEIVHNKQFLLFINRGTQIERYPAVYDYLNQHRQELESRSTVPSHPWYELTQPQTGIHGYFQQPKIVFPDIASSPSFALDETGTYLADTTFMIPSKDEYLLGVLNSNVVDFFFGSIASQIRGGYLRFKYQYVKRIPIPVPSDGLRQEIIGAARQCLAAAGTTPEKLPILEAELNALVYQAYGLDDDDIAVIEEAVK